MLADHPRLYARWNKWLEFNKIEVHCESCITNHRFSITKEFIEWTSIESRGMSILLLSVLDIYNTGNDDGWVRNVREFVLPYLKKYVEPLV